MDRPACRACGAAWTRLDPDGVCAWQGGCEHRRDQAAAADARFAADYAWHFDPLSCGHTHAEHAEQWAEIARTRFVPPPGLTEFMHRMTDPVGYLALEGDYLALDGGTVDGGFVCPRCGEHTPFHFGPGDDTTIPACTGCGWPDPEQP